MEALKLSEQDIINAVCLMVAHKKQIRPEEVLVELLWDDDYGFSAEIEVQNRQQVFIESNLIEAIRFWLEHNHYDPYRAALELALDENEGIIANVRY